MWADYVEWSDMEAHFSMGIDIDTLEQIMSKGSLEDGHKDIIFAALKEAWTKL